MAFMVWLSVCIQLMNQNASPTLSGNVRAALPIRATRDIMNGNHATLINPITHGWQSPVSHKVSAFLRAP
jgi:hypothetical protein